MEKTIFLAISRKSRKKNYHFSSDIDSDYAWLKSKGRLTNSSFDEVSFKAKDDEDMKEQFLKILNLGKNDCFQCELINIDDLLDTINGGTFDFEYYFIVRIIYDAIIA